MVRKVFLLAVLVLALPMAAYANSVDFSNHGGVRSESSGVLSPSGLAPIAVSAFNGGGLITGFNLGSVSFSTGALISGSPQSGGSLTLLGTGLVGLASLVRRKFKA